MDEQQALAKMIAPGTPRPGKWRSGVIQVWVTRACDKACFSCTQGSNLAGKPGFITLEQFEQALLSLKGYFGVVGVFGGNPAMHPQFVDLCALVREHVPFEQRGLWCNNPLTPDKARAMRETFNPAVSNLNVHLDQEAFDMFKTYWPESMPFGLHKDSRHSPPFVSMKDLGISEEDRWELISRCDINQHWSAMIGIFRGELRAWFCEIAGAQAMLHQNEPDYPDTGMTISPDGATSSRICNPGEGAPPQIIGILYHKQWWQLDMFEFRRQVRKHCHDCGVPLRGYGQLAQSSDPNDREQTSSTHADIYRPKRKGRGVRIVTNLEQLGTDRLKKITDYLGNAFR